MTPGTAVTTDSASTSRFSNLPTVLKVAAILLTLNALLMGWFWISPNWGSPAEPRGLAEDSALAQAKPSPFYMVEEETRHRAKKAIKLKPIIVAMDPPPEVAALQPSAAEPGPTEPAAQRAEDALVARYAETRVADRP